jgi:hypothetical protein
LISIAGVTHFLSVRKISNESNENLRSRYHQLFFLALTAIAASIINPMGYEVWASAFRHALLLGELKAFISEFDTALKWSLITQIWALPVYWTFWCSSCVVILLLTVRERGISFATAVGILGLILSFKTARSMPFLPFLTILAWSDFFGRFQSLKSIESDHKITKSNTKSHFKSHTKKSREPAKGPLNSAKPSPWARVPAFLLLILSSFLCVSVVNNWFYESQASRKRFGLGLSSIAHPIAIANYFLQSQFKGFVFNPPEDGGYLSFYNPSLKLYGDTQFTEVQPTKDYVMAVAPE